MTLKPWGNFSFASSVALPIQFASFSTVLNRVFDLRKCFGQDLGKASLNRHRPKQLYVEEDLILSFETYRYVYFRESCSYRYVYFRERCVKPQICSCSNRAMENFIAQP